MLDGKFIQGTTPTHSFELPFDKTLISELSVTYCQSGKIVIKKILEECTLQENVLTVTLTQEETLSFEADKITDVQLKIGTTTGNVMASPKYYLAVEKVSDREVFLDEKTN